MKRWKRNLSALSALAMVSLVGTAPPSGAHEAAFDPSGHVHAGGFAPRDTRCANLLSGAESLNQPEPSAFVDPQFPDENDPVWGQNAQQFGPGGFLTWPSPLGLYGPATNAGDAVDHHWVHDDPRVGDAIEPLLFDFGTPVLTVDYYPFHDHPEDPIGDPYAGRLFGSNDPNVLGTPLDLQTVWDEGWDTANPTTYVDDFVQRFVSTTGPVRYIHVLTDTDYRLDTEVDAVCTPEPPGEDPPPPGGGGGEGCTPGFWKQSQHSQAWIGTGYNPGDSFETVFGVPATTFPGDPTLLQVLGQGGGGMNALGRHAVAGLLNAAASDVDYSFTTAQVIAMVQDAVASGDFETAKTALADENESGCPIDGKSPQSVPV